MRIFPRFSLRFAWITLTIFLIVFGIVVNYYQRFQAHERIATQLMNVGCDVEEESIQLLGFEIGKRLRGIQITSQNDMAYMKLLKQLPRPHELQRFGTRDLVINQESIAQLIDSVDSFSGLEELYLQDIVFTQDQVLLLGRLSQLSVLDLSHCNLPAGSLKLLEQMPRLTKLILNGTTFDPAELLQLNLPQLRIVNLSGSSLTELAMTKSGWGRFPCLETLSLRESKLRQVTAEPGALPQLRHLDLGQEGSECQIDWKNLAAAMPELTLLAVPMAWFEPAVIPELSLLAKLRYFYFDEERLPVPTQELLVTDNGQRGILDRRILQRSRTITPSFGPRDVQNFAPRNLVEDEQVLPASWLLPLKEWIKQRPDLLFSWDYEAVQQMLNPAGQGVGKYGECLWSTPNWKPNPHYPGGRFRIDFESSRTILPGSKPLGFASSPFSTVNYPLSI